MQRVALAGVLAMQPNCVIFDESTAMLDPRGRLEVLNTMRSLHEHGITVLFITHFMEEAAKAERILVFKQGKIVFDNTPKTLFADVELLKRCGLEQPITLQLLKGLRELDPSLALLSPDFESSLRLIPVYPGKSGFDLTIPHVDGLPAAVQVSHLSHVYLPGTPLEQRALIDVSFAITSGQSHGLAGATGSGKSTLLQHLNGLYRPQSGEVRIGPYSVSDPALDIKALRRYAGLVFQNPEIYFFEQYVGDEIAYGPRLLYGREGLRERVQKAMQLVGLDFEAFKDRLTYRLSGGEKRKVALAATLALQPKVLVLDEPTAGLDPASRRNLHATLKGFQRDGIEMILSSHSMGDIAELATNLTIMAKGRALRTGNTAELFNDAELIAEGALGQPSVVRFGAAFREKGWPIPVSVITADQLFSAVSASIRKGDGVSEFDFLARIPLGQYVSTGSILHRLDPRAKVFIFLLLIIALTFGQSLIGLGIGLALPPGVDSPLKDQPKICPQIDPDTAAIPVAFCSHPGFLLFLQKRSAAVVFHLVFTNHCKGLNGRRHPFAALCCTDTGTQPGNLLYIHF